MRILGIDPGNEESAYVLYDPHDHKVLVAKKVSNHDLLTALRMDRLRADVLAIEMIASMGMAVGQSVFETCVMVGRIVEAWSARCGMVEYVYRKDVKMHLCQSMRAKDANIRQAVMDRFGSSKEAAIGKKAKPGPLYGISADQWSALAVCITYHERKEA